MNYSKFLDNVSQFNIFTIVIIMILNIADYITTLRLNSMNFIELNPMFSKMLESNNFVAFFLIKVVMVTGVLFAVIFIEKKIEDRFYTNMIIRSMMMAFTLMMLIIVPCYVLVVINNIQLISGVPNILEGVNWVMFQ